MDVDKFKGADPGNNPPLFAAVGRLAEKKGPQFSIRAFALALQKVPEAKLVMVGSGELMNSIQKLIKELNIEHAVELKGSQPQEYISKLLQSSRGFIQHSKRASSGDSEGTPVSILEASSSGLPVISTTHAGIKDAVVDGKTGFLVEEGDIHGMADYIVNIAQNENLATELGAAGRQYMIENYSNEVILHNLKKIILSVLR